MSYIIRKEMECTFQKSQRLELSTDFDPRTPLSYYKFYEASLTCQSVEGTFSMASGFLLLLYEFFKVSR